MAFFYKQAPVQEGQELDVKIEAVGEKGDGIARVDGFVLFVPGTKTGDEVKIKVTRVLSKVGFAEVVGKSSATPATEQAEAAPAEEEKEEKKGKKKAKKTKEAKKEKVVEEIAEEEEDTDDF